MTRTPEACRANEKAFILVCILIREIPNITEQYNKTEYLIESYYERTISNNHDQSNLPPYPVSPVMRGKKSLHEKGLLLLEAIWVTVSRRKQTR